VSGGEKPKAWNVAHKTGGAHIRQLSKVEPA
jgi:hypothetical protein